MPTLPELDAFYKAHSGLITLIGLVIGFVSLYFAVRLRQSSADRRYAKEKLQREQDLREELLRAVASGFEELVAPEVYHGRALAIMEKALGNEHPETAGYLNNCGNDCYAQGHYRDAEGYHRLAVAIQEKTLGKGTLPLRGP
jgi:hypothetical protein